MCLGARRSYTLLNTPASRHPIFAHVFAFGAAHWSLPSLCCHHSARRSTLIVFATCTVALHGCMHTACCLCQSLSSLYGFTLVRSTAVSAACPSRGMEAQHNMEVQHRKERRTLRRILTKLHCPQHNDLHIRIYTELIIHAISVVR